ncbi:hypothetical protein Ssi02_44950 [Sinosporangium siamense]|uniref:Uncharacterized protein n=1 Tax=Sinosporangium siamense TaxID=1367973 RepID=A0A919VDL9_9ACTN|nr:hypothetical protein Ssi02_44950 [Sinosporangium siamense]
MLAEVLGRYLRFHAQSDEEARADMARCVSERYIEAFFSFYSAGTLDESLIYPTVEEATGAPPRTFRQWAAAHRAAFSQV